MVGALAPMAVAALLPLADRRGPRPAPVLAAVGVVLLCPPVRARPPSELPRSPDPACAGDPARRQAGRREFATGILRTLGAALDLRDRRDQLTPHGFLSLRGKIEAEIDWLLSWRPAYALNARFVKHLRSERPHLFTFLDVPGLEATNWPAETEIRPAVLARKLSGCNRTERGGSRSGADHHGRSHGPEPAPRRLRPPAPGRARAWADRSRPSAEAALTTVHVQGAAQAATRPQAASRPGGAAGRGKRIPPGPVTRLG